MSTLGRLVRFFGMVVRYLGVLGRIALITLFVGICGGTVRFGGFLVVLGCFMMIVLWHCWSYNQ